MPTQARIPISSAPERGTILLVEDDESLAQLFVRILRGAGFEVRSCRSGAEALRLLEVDCIAVDVVLSDIRVPLLSGDQLALALSAVRPGLPVLLMTGFSGTVTAENAHLFGVASVLQKPITPRELLRVVDEALQHRASHANPLHGAAGCEVASR